MITKGHKETVLTHRINMQVIWLGFAEKLLKVKNLEAARSCVSASNNLQYNK